MGTGFALTRPGRRGVLALGAGFGAAAVLPGRGARAQDFAGKTIEWIIPLQVGGGSDTWARFHLPFLQRTLPGQPTVVIRNITGGGGITGGHRCGDG